jgi:hypothetical protein
MNNFRKKKVAILFFGLTRSLNDVYSSLKTNIFDVLTENNIEYDIFIHTYALPTPYTNPYINTKIENYDNESYKLLNPKYYIIENQNNAENKLQIPKYFANLSDWAGCATTFEKKCFFVRNMVLAQHSKKMVTKLFREHQADYDYVIFTRPDQALHTKINPSVFNLLNNNNIVIPKEHSYLGVNDRLCFAKPNIAIIYGNSFNFLLVYSEKNTIVSEVFLKKYLKINNIHIIYSPITATLIRI